MDAIKAVAVDGKVFLYTVFYLCKKKKKNPCLQVVRESLLVDISLI